MQNSSLSSTATTIDIFYPQSGLIMLCHIACFALLGYLHFWLVSAEVITVGRENLYGYLDQNFWVDNSLRSCGFTHWSENPGSTVMFNFTGTAVTVIGTYGGRGGVSEVYIDDKLAGTIDRHIASGKDRCRIKAFEKTGLPFTEHTLKIVLVGNSTQWDSTVFNPGMITLSEIQYTIPDTITTTSNPSTSTAVSNSIKFTPTNPVTVSGSSIIWSNPGPALTSTGYTTSNTNIIRSLGRITGIVTGAFVYNMLLGSIA